MVQLPIKFGLLILLLLNSFILYSQVLIVDSTFQKIDISSYTSINKKELTLDDILDASNFIANNSFAFNFGKLKYSRWIKFELHNSSLDEKSLLFELTNPNIYHGRLYTFEEGNVEMLSEFGIKFPFSSRELSYPNVTLSISVLPNVTQLFWIEILPAINSSNFDILLWDSEVREKFQLTEVIYFTYYRFIHFVFLIILGVVLFITRQRWQWSLFIYIFIGAIYKYVDLGLAFKNIWPECPEIQQLAPIILVNLYCVASVYFIRRYFDTRIKLPFIDRVLLSITYVCQLIIFIRLLRLFTSVELQFLSVLQSINALLFLTLVLIVIIILVIYLRRRVSVDECIWFLICFSPPMVIFILSSLRQVGIFAVNTAVLSDLPIYLASIDEDNLFVWAIIWEVLCVIVLLIYRLDKLFGDNLKVYKLLEVERKESVQRLMTSIESDRKRVAQELHDSSGVSLSVIKMRMTVLKDESKDGELKMKLLSIMEDVDQVSKEIREISHFIMPISLSKLGLKAALKEMINKLDKVDYSINFYIFQQYDEKVLSQTISINIYRICQELVNNIIKHAQATEVSLNIVQEDIMLNITVEDNGIGFKPDTRPNGMGMNSIHLRTQLIQGTIRIESSPQSGSFFHIQIPLNG